MTEPLSRKEGHSKAASSNPEENPPSIQLLPDELLVEIFANLSAPDALKSSLVCWQWNTVLNDMDLWKFFLKRDLRCDFVSLNTERDPKEVYRSKHPSYLNLSKGVYSTREISVGSSCCVDCVQIKEQDVFVAYRLARKIEVWDLKSGSYKNALADEQELISRGTGMFATLIPTDEGKLISGLGDSFENTKIAVWDLATNACMKIFLGKPDHIFLKKGRLIAHNWDGNIEIWNLESDNCEKSIDRTREAPPDCCILSKDGKKLFYGVRTNIEIWDLESGACATTLRGHQGTVISLAFTEEGKLISGSDVISPCIGGEIRIWNLENSECEQTLQGHDDAIISLIPTKNRKLISGSSKGEIKVWNLQNGECQTTFKIGIEKMDSLTFTEEGELVMVISKGFSMRPHLRILDFTASRETIFQELAGIFDRCPETPSIPYPFSTPSEAFQNYKTAMQRFSRMPAEDREKIYAELHELLKSSSSGYSGSAEQAFHDLNNQTASPQLKAQAINKYLNFLKPRESK